MLAVYLRRLLGSRRTRSGNRQLGLILAGVAGAINAGGFLAVQQYTSHMTGIVSSMADNLVLGAYSLVLSGLGGLLCFLLGAICSAMLVHYARRRRRHSEFALPLLLEALLLLGFGLLGARLSSIEGLFVPLTVMLLCFIMGLQNALITKLSHAEIRTTHITGIVTDIGIELGKLFYWNRTQLPPGRRVQANRQRLLLHSALALSFFAGGVLGALGFKHLGYSATLPLALLLVMLASVAMTDDWRSWQRRRQRRR